MVVHRSPLCPLPSRSCAWLCNALDIHGCGRWVRGSEAPSTNTGAQRSIWAVPSDKRGRLLAESDPAMPPAPLLADMSAMPIVSACCNLIGARVPVTRRQRTPLPAV